MREETNIMTNRIRYTLQNAVANTFYQLPDFILHHPEFDNLCSDAKILYAVLLRRHKLSLRNNWHDSNGDIYFYFSRTDMQAVLKKSDKTIKKIVEQLKECGLLDEEAQGLNKPNKLYLLLPQLQESEMPKWWRDINEDTPTAQQSQGHGNIPTPNTEDLRPQTRSFSESGHGNFPTPDSENFRPNYIDISYIENKEKEINNTHTISSSLSCQVSHVSQVMSSTPDKKDGQDRHDAANSYVSDRQVNNSKTLEMPKPQGKSPSNVSYVQDDTVARIESYSQLIKDNIEFSYFASERRGDIGLISSFVDIIVDTVFTISPTMRIGGEEKSRAVVSSVFSKLNHQDIIYALHKFKSVETPITNKTAYIRTLLYNCKQEQEAQAINLYQRGADDEWWE